LLYSGEMRITVCQLSDFKGDNELRSQAIKFELSWWRTTGLNFRYHKSGHSYNNTNQVFYWKIK